MSTPRTPSVSARRRPHRGLRGLLTRRIGSPAADRVLWGSGVVGAVVLLLAIAAPALGPLVLFLLLTVWTNGPYSPVLPATYEPILMLFGKLYPPLLIAVVATAGTVYVEYLNYHLYAAGAERLPERVRAHPLLARVERWYARAPFATVIVAALTPLPYWLVRVLSALTRYPVRRHLAATAIGRFPRLWFFAAIATPLGIPTPWLVFASVAVLGVMVLVAGARLVRRRSPPRTVAGPVPLTPSAEVPCCS